MAIPEWLDGWERRPRGHSGFYSGGPLRFLFHTTEGGLAGSIGALDANNSWPQLLVDPGSRRKIQAYPLSQPGRALANRSGGVETNRRSCVQVEIVGRAAESPYWSDDVYRFLGESLGPVIAACGIPLRIDRPFVGPEAGTIATPHAPQRFSFDLWNNFAGCCGHQNVPENDHWNPGRFDWERFARYAGGAAAPSAPPTFEIPDEGEGMTGIFFAGWFHRFYADKFGRGIQRITRAEGGRVVVGAEYVIIDGGLRPGVEGTPNIIDPTPEPRMDVFGFSVAWMGADDIPKEAIFTGAGGWVH